MGKNEQAVSSLHRWWLEQEEPDPIAVDYRGESLYYGDETFCTEDGLVRDEDVYEYMERKYGKTVTLED